MPTIEMARAGALQHGKLLTLNYKLQANPAGTLGVLKAGHVPVHKDNVLSHVAGAGQIDRSARCPHNPARQE